VARASALPRPGSAAAWLLASRPKTLAASVAPVAVGAALAFENGVFAGGPALAALAGALFIQVGTNLANDVADFRRGADTAERLGPTRAVQAGLLSERAAVLGAGVAFALAVVFGAYLAVVAGWPVVAIGAAGIAAGVLYTAGPWPLAYLGLGDVFVLGFFGVAAVAGTYYVQALRWSGTAAVLGVACGCLAVGLLAVNNLRDVDTDRSAGKRTLAVRLGPAAMRAYVAALVAAAFVLPVLLVASGAVTPWALAVLMAVPWALGPLRIVLARHEGAVLNAALGGVARLALVHATFLAAGLVAGAV
jgi:1,4-dihydroxy-2-naphthoate polyprenyltransferase